MFLVDFDTHGCLLDERVDGLQMVVARLDRGLCFLGFWDAGSDPTGVCDISGCLVLLLLFTH